MFAPLLRAGHPKPRIVLLWDAITGHLFCSQRTCDCVANSVCTSDSPPRVLTCFLSGGRSTLLYNMSNDAKWHAFSLHADVAPSVQEGAGSEQVGPQGLHVQLLDLLQPEKQEERKNEGDTVCEPCKKQSHAKK